MYDISFDDSEIRKALGEAQDNLDKFIPKAIAQGGDMVADRAKQEHDYKDQTEALTTSIKSLGVAGKFSSGSLNCEVGAGAPHGEYLEYGTDSHMVKPKHRKALRWPVEGGYAHSKGHMVSGIRERAFMANALDSELDDIVDETEAATELAFRRAGL